MAEELAGDKHEDDDDDWQRPKWLTALGIHDLESGRAEATRCLERILEPAREVLGRHPLTTTVLVYQGFVARAQALHLGALAAIRARNPAATFTLLRAYAENAAAILWAKDHPRQVGRFVGENGQRPPPIGRITSHASSSNRFAGFAGMYAQLSEFAHPGPLGLLVSTRPVNEDRWAWQSSPRFRRNSDQVTSYGWVVELAEASHHLLYEFAEAHQLGRWAPSAEEAKGHGLR